jgi:predicted acyltransferase
MATNTQRFITLDVFRGMTVFLMIVVNTQGSGALPYAQLEHAPWNGCTLTDLVFPSFLFAVGNAMAFVGQRRQGNTLIFSTAAIPTPQAGSSVLLRMLRRSLLLFLIGFLLAWYPFRQSLSDTRILSVLQRIALCYLFATLATRALSTRAIVWLCILLLLGYWALLVFLGDPGAQYTVAGNAVRKLDLLALGERHMYREGALAFDPEGLLSTLPAVVNVLIGWLVGKMILKKGRTLGAVSELFLSGLILILVAWAWSHSMPLNKKLWTSSYVLFSTGIDLAAIAVLFYLIEMRSWKPGVFFFSIFGRNPLFIYIFSNLIGIFLVMRVAGNALFIDWINTLFFQKIAPGPLGDLLFSVCFTLLCWSLGWLLDRRKIYIRL